MKDTNEECGCGESPDLSCSHSSRSRCGAFNGRGRTMGSSPSTVVSPCEPLGCPVFGLSPEPGSTTSRRKNRSFGSIRNQDFVPLLRPGASHTKSSTSKKEFGTFMGAKYVLAVTLGNRGASRRSDRAGSWPGRRG